MNKLILILFLVIGNVLFCQISYTSLSNYENVLLDRYGIDYTGLHTRYMVNSNDVYTIEDDSIIQSMILNYNKFLKWNNGKFNIIPDTTINIMSGYDLLNLRGLPEWYGISLNDRLNVISQYQEDVNDINNNIKTIEIIEGFDKPIKQIIHIILIQDYNGVWWDYSEQLPKENYFCPQCSVD